MADMKKLRGFRQLSLNCDKSQTRPTLRRQFSEDITDKDFDYQISLKNFNLKNPIIRQAWVDPIEGVKDELIIKKIDEHRPKPKLLPQGSLDFAKRLQQTLKNNEERCNLKIFLSHQNSVDFSEEKKCEDPPKIIKYLSSGVEDKTAFKIKKSIKIKDANSSDIFWQVPNKKPENHHQANTVVPLTEKDHSKDIKPIASVLITPSPAAWKREMFQKRTNSAFHTTVDLSETQNPKPRRPLVRSLSAPCKPAHSKSKKLILQSKPKNNNSKKLFLKTASRTNLFKNKEQAKSPTDLNNIQNAQIKDVVTMVSLVSPAGSDCEEEIVVEDIKKNISEPKPSTKLTFSKVAKTVSFQQSSIHAIRSFSASFPARRASVSSMMFNTLNATPGSKPQEKRTTNSNKPDDDERMPKRRLVRNKENSKTASLNQPKIDESAQKATPSTSNISKNAADATEDVNTTTEENEEVQNNNSDESKSKENEKELIVDRDLKSDKEKQCWSMYCKMTEKGINVSFDTILKGMLTPTEYRLSKKHSVSATSHEPLQST